MDVFSLRQSLIGQYASFARSFTTIRADDIRAQVEQEYDSGRFWPEPLVQINPRFEYGKTLDQLVDDGVGQHETCSGRRSRAARRGWFAGRGTGSDAPGR